MTEPATNYQHLAADYARHRRVHPGVVEQLLQAIRQHDAADILDVGCGSGNYLAVLVDLTRARVVGIDPSAAMLDELAQRLPAAETRVAPAEAIPYPDASFDLLYSVDVIHHVRDRDAWFREARRVLRPGGLVVMVTDSPTDLARRVPLTSHFPETLAHERSRYPDIETLQAEMTAAGFGDLRLDHVELSYPLTDISAYRNRAYSALHLIDADAHAAGMARLEADLERGPIEATSLYTLVWGTA